MAQLNPSDAAHADHVDLAAERRLPEGTPTSTLRLVAHELRAHVTVLSGYADLLRDPVLRDDAERREELLNRIGDQVSSLREMSEHLVRAIRVGGQQAQFGTVDLIELGVHAAAEVEGLANSTGCSVSVDEPEPADRFVEGDHFQLNTAIRNLLENACRHGPVGGRVVLRLRTTSTRVRIWVRDQGTGLEALGRAAFAPLTQGVGSDRAGMGLGLSVVREVARQHGGRAFWGRDDDGSWVGLEYPR